MKVRVPKHRGASPRSGKPVKGTLPTSVRDHMLFCDHQVAWEDCRILESKSNNFILALKESWFTKRDKTTLNWNQLSH